MTDPKYVVFDTESNGLFDYSKPADADGQPRLASVCFITADAEGNKLDKQTIYVKPDGWSIDGTEASEVNGLTDAILNEKGVPVSDVLDIWNGFIDAGLIMAAYNAQHDTKFMRAESRRAGRPDRFEETPNTCLMKAMKAYKDQGAPLNNFGTCKLQVACEWFGFEETKNLDWHDADADTEAALLVMQRLIKDGNLIDPGVRYAKNKPETPQKGPQGGIDGSPATPMAGTDLVLAEGASLVDLFKVDANGVSGLLPTIEAIEAEVRAETYSIATKADRDRIKSVAYKVARSKTALDAAGEQLKADAQKVVNAVNADRRMVKDRLDSLRDEVRKPLTEWEEAENARMGKVERTLNVMDVTALASHMQPVDIRNRMSEVNAINLEASWWGDQKAEAELRKAKCMEEWPAVLEAAEQRVKDAEELTRLRQEQEERAAKEAQAAREAEEKARQEQEEAERDARHAEAAKVMDEARRRRLATEFEVSDAVSSETPVYELNRLLEVKRSIQITDAEWGSHMELAAAKQQAIVAKLEGFIVTARAREDEEARKAEEQRREQEDAAQRDREAMDAEKRDEIIGMIAEDIEQLDADAKGIAAAIYDGNVRCVCVRSE